MSELNGKIEEATSKIPSLKAKKRKFVKSRNFK